MSSTIDQEAMFLAPGERRAYPILNFSAPGNFEQHMPAIAEWFIDNPPGQAL